MDREPWTSAWYLRPEIWPDWTSNSLPHPTVLREQWTGAWDQPFRPWADPATTPRTGILGHLDSRDYPSAQSSNWPESGTSSDASTGILGHLSQPNRVGDRSMSAWMRLPMSSGSGGILGDLAQFDDEPFLRSSTVANDPIEWNAMASAIPWRLMPSDPSESSRANWNGDSLSPPVSGRIEVPPLRGASPTDPRTLPS